MSVNCTLFPDLNKCHSLIIIKKVSGSVSIIGCLFVIVVIWIFQKYKLFVQRIILNLSIAALLYSIAFLMSEIRPDNPFCTFEGWYLMFFVWTVLLWICCITINLFITAVLERRTDKILYEIAYHAVCWGVSLFISLLPFIDNAYGPAGAWCWIKENHIEWRFGAWYVPQFLLFIILLFLYIYITYILRKNIKRWEGFNKPEKQQRKQFLQQEIKPLLFYPLFYLILTLLPLINRIQNAIAPENPIFALYVLHAVFSPLLGACNAIIYTLDRQTLSKLKWTEIKLALRSKTSHEPVSGEMNIEEPGVFGEVDIEEPGVVDIEITNKPVAEGGSTPQIT